MARAPRKAKSKRRTGEPEILRTDRVDGPGLYLMSADDYHRDPCPAPSLSASIAHELVHHSPRHAWEMHPKLNPAWRLGEPTDAMELGSALHWLMLGAGRKPYLVNAPDWRSHSARLHRDEARRQGRPPILEWRWPQVKRIAAAARIQLRRMRDAPAGIDQGLAEAVLIWREGKTWCRAMVDWLPTKIPNPPLIDLKFTEHAGTPEDYRRQVHDLGYDLRQSWYRRGFEAVFGRPAGPYVFAVVETQPPYGVACYAVGPAFEELGESKVSAALEAWSHCMRTGRWPGYAPFTMTLEPPVYAADDWTSRAHRMRVQLHGVENVLRMRGTDSLVIGHTQEAFP